MTGSTATCPYCGAADCEADWVDVGVGEVQCGPYACLACGALEIGPHDRPTLRSAVELETNWYRPCNASATVAPTVGGSLVGDHKAAAKLYEWGLLDAFDRRPVVVAPADLGRAIVSHYMSDERRTVTLDLVTSKAFGKSYWRTTYLPDGTTIDALTEAYQE